MACGYGAAVYSEGICLLTLYNIIFINILNSPQCSCGKQKDAYHLILFLYVKIIPLPETLFSIACSCLNWSILIIINLLLCGDVNLPLQINNRIFAAVQLFMFK